MMPNSAPPPSTARSTGCATAPKRPCTAATTSSSSPTAWSGPDRIPIPALLATAAVHNYLIRKGLRTSVGLVVESGEPREIHHFACLAGYGAEAINPVSRLRDHRRHARQGELPEEVDEDEAVKRYIKSIGKGLLKVMSKMGISTYQSYCGAQIFDAVGLRSDFVNRDFFGTATTIEGIGMDEIAEENVRRHRDAFGDAADLPPRARCGRRIRLPPARRGACLESRTRWRRSSTRCASTRRIITASSRGS